MPLNRDELEASMPNPDVGRSGDRVEYRVVIVRRAGDALTRRVEIVGNARACWNRQVELGRTHPEATVTVEKRYLATPWEECDALEDA